MKKRMKKGGAILSAACLVIALLLSTPAAGITASAEEAVPTTETAAAVATDSTVSYQGLTFSVLGDSISTFTGTMPSDYNLLYPQDDVQYVSQMWWSQVAEKTGMTLLSNGSSANTNVCGDSTDISGSAPGCSFRRVIDLAGTDGSSPDVIFIYMGINDFARCKTIGNFTGPGVQSEGDIEVFSDAYELMLIKIKALYPNAQIFCLTLIERGFTEDPAVNNDGHTIEEYNQQIKAVATAYGATVVDLYNNSGITNDNLELFIQSDMVHPNWAGATLIADCVVRAMYGQ